MADLGATRRPTKPEVSWTRSSSLGAVVLALVLAGATILAAQSGCSSNGEAALRTSRRGEVCQVANDCGDGLSCAPIPGGGGGGICVTGNFKVTKTAKECAFVECVSAIDCCDDSLAAGCAQLRMLCDAEKDAGTTPATFCNQYNAQCGCQTGAVTCEVGKCVTRCSLDAQCNTGGPERRCAGGKCVQCAIDNDCSGGRRCVSGQCQVPCTNDGSCSGFDRCLEGRCVASGCQTDRECIAATRNVDARCGTDGKCIVPCETDLECGSPTSYSFFSCIDKQCTYVGCESDKDCRLFLTGPTDATTLPVKQVAVCRDKGSIGDVVKP
jgi:hypothetical protein